MPPQLAELLQNRRLMAIIGGAIALLILLIIGFSVMGGGGDEVTNIRKLREEERVLAKVDNIGKAIEIQALLARENISLVRKDIEGGKADLWFQKDATTEDRDRAFVTLVQSGLMDKNVGLEIFEKGDLTASREEKRIKLVRARNGELARLIRKIDPIQDASVFISMPEPTIFKRDRVPPTATIQVTLSPGEKLSRDKVRAIINLIVGSIENINAKDIALTDTNGTVYNSVLDPVDELMDRLEERDRYMEQKVKTQLDRLIGRSKYVVTVSTYLRESSRAEMALNYDPKRSTVSKTASFGEDLNSNQDGPGTAAGPVSSYIPEEVDVTGAGSQRAQRGYKRSGQEVEFNTGRKQVTEDFVPGMIEEITIAVTVDENAFPKSIPVEEFKTLVARSASPLVNPENVSILTGEKENLVPIRPVPETKSAIPWWIWALIAGVGILVLLIVLALLRPSKTNDKRLEDQEKEIQELRDIAQNQAQQLQSTQQQAEQAIQQQQQQIAQLTSQQTQPDVVEQANELKETLSELKAVLEQEEEELEDEALGSEMKSWIESS